MLEKRITHERLTAICLGLLDDLDLLSERYNDLLNNQPVRVWKTAFKGEYAIYDLNHPNNIYKNEEDKKEGSSVSEESEGESEEDDNDE